MDVTKTLHLKIEMDHSQVDAALTKMQSNLRDAAHPSRQKGAASKKEPIAQDVQDAMARQDVAQKSAAKQIKSIDDVRAATEHLRATNGRATREAIASSQKIVAVQENAAKATDSASQSARRSGDAYEILNKKMQHRFGIMTRGVEKQIREASQVGRVIDVLAKRESRYVSAIKARQDTSEEASAEDIKYLKQREALQGRVLDHARKYAQGLEKAKGDAAKADIVLGRTMAGARSEDRKRTEATAKADIALGRMIAGAKEEDERRTERREKRREQRRKGMEVAFDAAERQRRSVSAAHDQALVEAKKRSEAPGKEADAIGKAFDAAERQRRSVSAAHDQALVEQRRRRDDYERVWREGMAARDAATVGSRIARTEAGTTQLRSGVGPRVAAIEAEINAIRRYSRLRRSSIQMENILAAAKQRVERATQRELAITQQIERVTKRGNTDRVDALNNVLRAQKAVTAQARAELKVTQDTLEARTKSLKQPWYHRIGQSGGAGGAVINAGAMVGGHFKGLWQGAGTIVGGGMRVYWTFLSAFYALRNALQLATMPLTMLAGAVKTFAKFVFSAAKDLLMTAGETEGLEARLTAFKGISPGITKWIVQQAVGKPFQWTQIGEAFQRALAMGAPSEEYAKKKLMPVAYDLASSFMNTGKGGNADTILRDAVMAIMQGAVGNFSRLTRSFGFTATNALNYGAAPGKGGRGVSSAPEDMQRNLDAIMAMLNDRVKGTSEAMADALQALHSDMEDIRKGFGAAFADTKVFQSIKGIEKSVRDTYIKLTHTDEKGKEVANGALNVIDAWMKRISDATIKLDPFVNEAMPILIAVIDMAVSGVEKLASGIETIFKQWSNNGGGILESLNTVFSTIQVVMGRFIDILSKNFGKFVSLFIQWIDVSVSASRMVGNAMIWLTKRFTELLRVVTFGDTDKKIADLQNFIGNLQSSIFGNGTDSLLGMLEVGVNDISNAMNGTGKVSQDIEDRKQRNRDVMGMWVKSSTEDAVAKGTEARVKAALAGAQGVQAREEMAGDTGGDVASPIAEKVIAEKALGAAVDKSTASIKNQTAAVTEAQRVSAGGVLSDPVFAAMAGGGAGAGSLAVAQPGGQTATVDAYAQKMLAAGYRQTAGGAWQRTGYVNTPQIGAPNLRIAMDNALAQIGALTGGSLGIFGVGAGEGGAKQAVIPHSGPGFGFATGDRGIAAHIAGRNRQAASVRESMSQGWLPPGLLETGIVTGAIGTWVGSGAIDAAIGQAIYREARILTLATGNPEIMIYADDLWKSGVNGREILRVLRSIGKEIGVSEGIVKLSRMEKRPSLLKGAGRALEGLYGRISGVTRGVRLPSRTAVSGGPSLRARAGAWAERGILNYADDWVKGGWWGATKGVWGRTGRMIRGGAVKGTLGAIDALANMGEVGASFRLPGGPAAQAAVETAISNVVDTTRPGLSHLPASASRVSRVAGELDPDRIARVVRSAGVRRALDAAAGEVAEQTIKTGAAAAGKAAARHGAAAVLGPVGLAVDVGSLLLSGSPLGVDTREGVGNSSPEYRRAIEHRKMLLGLPAPPTPSSVSRGWGGPSLGPPSVTVGSSYGRVNADGTVVHKQDIHIENTQNFAESMGIVAGRQNFAVESAGR